jgi:hypothetical protein
MMKSGENGPAVNLLLYHGLLASHARWRSQVVRYGRPELNLNAHEVDASPAARGPFMLRSLQEARDRCHADCPPSTPPRLCWEQRLPADAAAMLRETLFAEPRG